MNAPDTNAIAVELLPDPSRLIEGLRDTGYEFNTALADIVDNSVAADARRVDVSIEQDFEGRVLVSVADDGCGMDKLGLLNAMRYGSSQRDDPASAQGSSAWASRRHPLPSVAGSRSSLARPPVQTRSRSRGTWTTSTEPGAGKCCSRRPRLKNSRLSARLPGTGPAHFVVWANVDRIFRTAFKSPSGGAAQNAFKKVCQAFKDHAAMVFQRFLDEGFEDARAFELYVNSEKIAPWDPFSADGASVELVSEKTPTADLPDGDENLSPSGHSCCPARMSSPLTHGGPPVLAEPTKGSTSTGRIG